MFDYFFGSCKAQDVKGMSDGLDADEADGKIGKIADPISCVPQKVKASKTGIDPKQFSVDVLVRGGDRYAEHRFYDKALMAYKSVLAQQPSNEEALIGQVRALRCLRTLDEAQRACRAALTTVPNSVALKSLQGELASAAEKKLSGETDAPPAVEKPLYQQGQIWPPIPSPAKDGAPAAAVQDMLLQGAHRFFELCLFEEARLGYASVISQKPNHEQALAGRCHTLWSLEMSTEAVAACEAGLKAIPFSEMLSNLKTKPEAPEVIAMTAAEAAEAAAEAEEEDDEVIELAPLSAEALKKLNFDGDKSIDFDSISQSGKSTTSTKSGKARKKGQGIGPDGKKLTRLEQARINVETMPEWTEEKKCPSSKSEADYKKELAFILRKNKEIVQAEEQQGLEAGYLIRKPDGTVQKNWGKMAMSGDPNDAWAGTYMAERDRACKIEMFKTFYKEQYARLASLDVSKYNQSAVEGLSLKGGHQPMERPEEGTVELPEDWKKDIGVITVAELLRHDCYSKRKFLCVMGDIFDVSDRPDKYGTEGPYWGMPGHDITWGLGSGNDSEHEFDKYYDIFKMKPGEKMDNQLQGLISWWCFYHKEYGEPVGILKEYEKASNLPAPPEVGDSCCIS
jgi:tetratricopeptide (TPR) repeat protein